MCRMTIISSAIPEEKGKRFKFTHLPSKQRGVALIFVLMIFAIITITSVRIIENLSINAELSRLLTNQLQAKHYAFSAEQYAAYLLEQDFLQDKEKGKAMLMDHWGEDWSTTVSAFEDEEVVINMEIVDDQSRFNLNQLAAKDNKILLERLKVLLISQEIDPQLVERLKSWLSLSQGDEQQVVDEYYLSMEPAYRASGQLLSSVSELRLLQLLSDEEYRKLEPLVSALPDVKAGLNINTAMSFNIMSLNKDLSESDAESVIAARGEEGFTDLDEVKQLPQLLGKVGDLNNITLNSRFFSVYISATYRNSTFYLSTNFERTNRDGRISILKRQFGEYPAWVDRLKEAARS